MLLLLLSDELMTCCAAGANGCLDLRRREFPLCGQVSVEWSRCPGSKTRHAKDKVAPLVLKTKRLAKDKVAPTSGSNIGAPNLLLAREPSKYCEN